MDHSKESWMNKSRVVLTKARGGKYEQPSPEQVEKGKKRRKLEDLKDEMGRIMKKPVVEIEL